MVPPWALAREMHTHPRAVVSSFWKTLVFGGGQLWNIMDLISYRKIPKCSKEQFICSPISLESMEYVSVLYTVCLFLGKMFWWNWLISATWKRGIEFLKILNFHILHENRQLSEGVVLKTSEGEGLLGAFRSDYKLEHPHRNTFLKT